MPAFPSRNVLVQDKAFVRGILSNTDERNPRPSAVIHEAFGRSSTGISEAQETRLSRNIVPFNGSRKLLSRALF